MFSRVTAIVAFFAMGGHLTAQTENLPPGIPEVIRDLDRIASDAAKSPADVGYTLGVVTRNGLAWTKSYCFADAGRQRPATPDAEYEIGTGAFTAVMLLQLMRDGKAHLSDPAESSCPRSNSRALAIPARRRSRSCSWHCILPACGAVRPPRNRQTPPAAGRRT